MNRKKALQTPPSHIEMPHSTDNTSPSYTTMSPELTEREPPAIDIEKTTPAAIIRQAYKYIIKFNKATTIIHIEHALIGDISWWQLVADIVCIHKLGIVPLLILNVDTTYSTLIDNITPHNIVRLFNRYEQKASIVYVSSNYYKGHHTTEQTPRLSTHDIFTDSNHISLSTSDLFEQLYRGTIPIIVIPADNRTELITSVANPPPNDVLLPSHLAIDRLCAQRHASKLMCLTTQPFFPKHSQQLTTPTSQPHTTHTDEISSSTQPEHLASSSLSASWIAQQSPRWHPLLRMIKCAANHSVQRMHIIAYNKRNHDSLLEELFSTKGIGFMVFTDGYATIRTPTEQDIPTLHAFYRPFVANNTLRNQDTARIRANLHRYYIYELDGEIVAACNCLPLTERLYELGALATDPALHSGGLATQLLHHVCRAITEQHATNLSSCSMIAITTSAHSWFVQHGFINIELEELPQSAKQQVIQRNRHEQRVLGSIYYAPLNTIV